ncbi:MAG TPA: acyl-CoA dehydrogenase family protein [Acidimicrobiales bacterium]|nr:acyl-CoA dehydrogenase family protein [Acidimicrobiales bacterium]
MDFSAIELDQETLDFWAEVRAFCDEYVTEELHDEEHRTGDGFNLRLHLALGAKGWLLPTWPVEDGGAGLNAIQAYLISHELHLRRAPNITYGTTTMVLPAVLQWGSDELRSDVVPKVASGHARFCLGYSEPDSGSDIAAAKTRAVRDGEEWVIDGQKMFTTGAQNCQYAFLLTRTNPEAAKHKGLTMFLCPLDDAEIQAVHTLGGERTNMVFYDGIRIADKYRLGPVDQGWMVLLGPLNAEHAMGDERPILPLERTGGENYGVAGAHAYAAAVDWAGTSEPDGRRPIEDDVVRQRLARAALELELATTSTGPIGRILTSEMSIRVAEDLLSLVGPPGLLPRGEEGALAGGWLEYAHRFAQGTATYGGTTDIHRNILAERFLGLPRSSPGASKPPVG